MKRRPRTNRSLSRVARGAEFERQRNLLKAERPRKQRALKPLKNRSLRWHSLTIPYAISTICYLPILQGTPAKKSLSVIFAQHSESNLRSSMLPFTYAVGQEAVEAFLNEIVFQLYSRARGA